MGIIVPDPEEENEFFHNYRRKVFEVAYDSIGKSTLPIGHFKDGKLCEIRTGFLLALGDLQFLVTAGHYMQDHYEKGNTLAAIVPEKNESPVIIRPAAPGFLTTKDDSEDLTVVRLDPSTASELSGYYSFDRLDRIDSTHMSKRPSSLYLLYGYPRDMVEKDTDGGLVINHWKYLTIPFQHEIPKIAEQNLDFHEFFSYDRRALSESGQQVEPHGFSGCGIYSCGMPQTHQPFSEKHLRLVAVQTSWNRTSQYVKATSIRVVLIILWKYFSDARDVLELHGHKCL